MDTFRVGSRCLVLAFVLCAPCARLYAEDLSDIFYNMGAAGEAAVRLEAQAQAADDRPGYKSVSVETRMFEGIFVPASSGARLAVFSDDGARVYVNGNLVHDRFGKPQHLPALVESFRLIWPVDSDNADPPEPTEPPWESGEQYHIVVEYSNIRYDGDYDIDGITLIAFDGGGAVFAMPPGWSGYSTYGGWLLLGFGGKVHTVADACKLLLGAGVVDMTKHLTIKKANKNLTEKRFWFFFGYGIVQGGIFKGIEVDVPLTGGGDLYDDNAMVAGLSTEMALIMACFSAKAGGKGQAMKEKLGAQVWVGPTIDIMAGRMATITDEWMAASDGQRKVFEVKAAVVKKLGAWLDKDDIGIIGDSNFILDTTP